MWRRSIHERAPTRSGGAQLHERRLVQQPGHEGGEPVKVHDLKPAPGSARPRRRVGRGIAGKGGKTAGRGMKGQGARGSVPPGFEGGPPPPTLRLPKRKGFRHPFRVEYAVVNLDTLDTMEGDEITPDTLRARGLVHKQGLVKELGRGQIGRAVQL